MYHPVDDHRINHIPHVVDRDVATQVHLACIWVHFHYRNVGPEGPGEVLGVEVAERLEPGLHSLGEAAGHVGCEGDLLDGLGLGRGAGDEELAVLVDDVRLGGLQQVRRQPLGLFLDFLNGHMDGRAAHRRAPAAKGADAKLHLGSVPVNDGHVLNGNPQLRGGYLGEGGLVTLAVGGASGVKRHLARGMEPDHRALPGAVLEPQ